MQKTGTSDNRRILKVYTIVEKPHPSKDIWLEIGVALENRDRSLRVKLDALPVGGQLHIREYEPKGRSDTTRQSGEQQPPSKWQ